MNHAAADAKPPKARDEIELSNELVEALDADPELAQAFHNLTPGWRKSYVFNLRSAKASATRMARIARFRDRILAGESTTER